VQLVQAGNKILQATVIELEFHTEVATWKVNNNRPVLAKVSSQVALAVVQERVEGTWGTRIWALNSLGNSLARQLREMGDREVELGMGNKKDKRLLEMDQV
jgi:hypothetical protein